MISGAASAQGLTAAYPSTYPSRPVTLILAIAAGGANDLEARLEAAKMGEFLGQPFLLDFKPGASGAIGNAYVAKSRPDGHTLLIATAAFTILPAFNKNLPYDTIKDFAPVSLMSQRTSVLVVRPSFPAQTFAEYIAYARANPAKINFGTTGVGGTAHLAGAWMHTASNTNVTFIPYTGTGPQLPDLYSGRLDAAPVSVSVALPLVKAGKVRALAVFEDKRSKLLPDLPTVAEQGIAGYNSVLWLGIAAPAATPAPIVNRLNEAFIRVAKSPDVISTLEGQGNEMVGSTPAQFRQLIATETERWRKVVQDAGIKIEN